MASVSCKTKNQAYLGDEVKNILPTKITILLTCLRKIHFTKKNLNKKWQKIYNNH